MKPKTHSTNAHAPKGKGRKRVVTYARVSTEDQSETESNYSSCQSQLDDLRKRCEAKGWEIVKEISDEGYSGGEVRRPGLKEVMALVREREVNIVMCTWIDRLARGRLYTKLEEEIEEYGANLIAVYSPHNRHTANGRFSQWIDIGMAGYFREQTGEKVSIKAGQRAEKGMLNGGRTPFGFSCSEDKILKPLEDKKIIVQQIYDCYVKTGSDYAVRDWLKAHQIPSPGGAEAWGVSSIRHLLTNRRYIAEIEINRDNKGEDDMPDFMTYRVAPAPHEPMVDRETFDLAQRIRAQKAIASPNRRGKPHSFSKNRCNRIALLQERMFCAVCGSSMSPTYTYKKAGEEKAERFYPYYICARQQMKSKSCGHKNRVRPDECEGWLLQLVSNLLTDEMLERAIALAQSKADSTVEPHKQRLSLNRLALDDNQAQAQKLIATTQNGEVGPSLMAYLNDEAERLRREREGLLLEQRQLRDLLAPSEIPVDPQQIRELLGNFDRLVAFAEPEELQRLIRLIVRRVEWVPTDSGSVVHRVEIYLSNQRQGNLTLIKNPNFWFESKQRLDGPDRIRTGDLLRDRQTC